MARQVTIEQVDAALDAIDDDSGVGRALADLITRHGEWDYGTAEAEGMTPELFAVVESSGAWWAVNRGSEGDWAIAFARYDDAHAQIDAWNEWCSEGVES